MNKFNLEMDEAQAARKALLAAAQKYRQEQADAHALVNALRADLTTRDPAVDPHTVVSEVCDILAEMDRRAHQKAERLTALIPAAGAVGFGLLLAAPFFFWWCAVASGSAFATALAGFFLLRRAVRIRARIAMALVVAHELCWKRRP